MKEGQLKDGELKQAAQAGEREAPYGYCPECGAPGVMRERRPDGDDKCSNGHRYPSRSAHTSLPTQPAAQATPDHAAEIARLKAVIDQLERREILAVAQQATPEPVEHKCRHCGVTTIEDEDGVTMHGLPAPERPIIFDPSADVPIPATPEPVIVKGAMAGMVDAQVRDLWPTKGAALAAQAKGGE